MQTSDIFMGHEIRVGATRNARGAWVADVRIYFNDVPVYMPVPELVTPEWLTQEEALRAGIEQGRRILKTHDR